MKISSPKGLIVYQKAYVLAMEIYGISKNWPNEEKFSLIDQIRRSLRPVCANLIEAQAKKRYEAHFVSKLSDSDTDNGETDTWLDFAMNCGFLSTSDHANLANECEEVGAILGSMINNPKSLFKKADL